MSEKIDRITRALNWATSSYKGCSSIALLRYWYFGEAPTCAPLDHLDANRCADFLRAVPEASERFRMLCEIDPAWAQWKTYIEDYARSPF